MDTFESGARLPACEPTASSALRVGRQEHTQVKLLLGLLGLAFGARLFVAFRYEINWDEFYFLSLIYRYLDGELSSGLQTFHVRLFTWIRWLGGDEVEQIILLRLLMLGLQLLTCGFIYRICRRYTGPAAALFAVLAYASVSYNVRMGASFRADPLVTCCLMASLDWLLAKKSGLTAYLLAGAATALALLLTLKSALYLPTLGIIMLVPILTSAKPKTAVFRLLAFSLAGLVIFWLLYLYHRTGVNVIDADKDVSMLANSFDKTVKHPGLLPRKRYLFRSFILDMAYWLTLLYGVRHVLAAMVNGPKAARIRGCILLALLLPLASVLFYRNAFPYFYAFILAPASLLCAIAWDSLGKQTDMRAAPNAREEREAREANIIKGLVLLGLGISLIGNGLVLPQTRNLDRQRQLLALVHRAFPAPTTYLDRCAMVASYPRVGFFMSTWGMDNYRRQNRPLLAQAIEERKPKFFIANLGSLDVEHKTNLKSVAAYRLLDPDQRALSDNYIHHWGELYVAGKRFTLENAASEIRFPIIIDGRYTLESEAKVSIDEIRLAPGETLWLEAGNHKIQGAAAPGRYTLRWGEHLYRPSEPAPNTDIFTGF
ncbi:glycosyltransferase family 39 protein [Shewanella salipaludis]|uniref:Glycosyltransferase RgtA/B/C/D-like domain-containing protein n=1 Tax=Shewanella salipaludis TaxID=2723052 RepID=A0A972JM88_9GAMM|nr:glycosyltransferase family 39 protein [Shewanella salipaludis]NMH64851.1 hypothetical protein [Shewanella salipaludis]